MVGPSGGPMTPPTVSGEGAFRWPSNPQAFARAVLFDVLVQIAAGFDFGHLILRYAVCLSQALVC